MRHRGMENGVWNMGYGTWNIEYEARNMEYGLWSMACDVWRIAYGVWSLEYGVWTLKPGVRSMSPARHFWRIAVLPQPQRLWNHPLQASFFGHRWIACDHPCALVSGVGPCLHLCALCNMEHRLWYMEYGLWNTIWKMGCGRWNMEYPIWSTA